MQDKQGPTLAGERALLVREQRRALEQRNARFDGKNFNADAVERAWTQNALVMREIVLSGRSRRPTARQHLRYDRGAVSLLLEEQFASFWSIWPTVQIMEAPRVKGRC